MRGRGAGGARGARGAPLPPAPTAAPGRREESGTAAKGARGGLKAEQKMTLFTPVSGLPSALRQVCKRAIAAPARGGLSSYGAAHLSGLCTL